MCCARSAARALAPLPWYSSTGMEGHQRLTSPLQLRRVLRGPMMRKGPLTPRLRRWLRKATVWTCWHKGQQRGNIKGNVSVTDARGGGVGGVGSVASWCSRLHSTRPWDILPAGDCAMRKQTECCARSGGMLVE